MYGLKTESGICPKRSRLSIHLKTTTGLAKYKLYNDCSNKTRLTIVLSEGADAVKNATA
jgi:hypothetical protein